MELAPWIGAAWAGAAAGCDAWTRRIPNALTIGAALMCALCFAATGRGPLGAAWGPSVLGALAVAAPAFALFAMGRMGAGDVKFLAALPLVGGPERAAAALLLGSALLLIGPLLFRALRPRLAGAALLLRWSRAPQGAPPWTGTIPQAVPFGLGFVIVLWGQA